MLHFLLTENNNAAEIHKQLVEVNGLDVTSDSKVRQWCFLFRDGRKFKL